MEKVTIKLSLKEALDIRELLLSLANAKYATRSQQAVLVKIVAQISN